ALQLTADQRMQPVERLAHVARSPIQVHPDLALGEEHQPRARCSTRPWPRSIRSSIRPPRAPAVSAPRSTKAVDSSAAIERASAPRAPRPEAGLTDACEDSAPVSPNRW